MFDENKLMFSLAPGFSCPEFPAWLCQVRQGYHKELEVSWIQSSIKEPFFPCWNDQPKEQGGKNDKQQQQQQEEEHVH